MISLDTNVVVRYLVRDHPEQTEAARALLEGLTPKKIGFISREVVVELVWVLERAYRFPRTLIADILLDLTATTALVVEGGRDTAQAALLYLNGTADFADAMILAAAKRVDALPLHTFDRRLAQMDGAVLAPTGQS